MLQEILDKFEMGDRYDIVKKARKESAEIEKKLNEKFFGIEESEEESEEVAPDDSNNFLQNFINEIDEEAEVNEEINQIYIKLKKRKIKFRFF